MKFWNVRGYSKTGIYSRVVEAKDAAEALKAGKTWVEKVAFGKVLQWQVDFEYEVILEQAKTEG